MNSIPVGVIMDFQQSQTFKNLMSAYERELATSTLYSIFSDRAVTEDFIEISNIFTTITRNEKEHARVFLKEMNNGQVPPTVDNLSSSAAFELETGDLYREYAQTAQTEGYTDIAAIFTGIANIEFNHNLQFQTQYTDIINNEVHCKPTSTLWICMQCGNILSGICAPEVCPVCGFPQGYYRVYENA
jgi:rubrerythrin